ncbi:pyrroloquinoline quinone biosynthesis peptide chaperone PqqD [Pseudoduganella sp. UC29_106]|uniref:pyrroloquinoline quinone biosynthesis peptide chaperone PqqD n=1 Tax=Pseudoduganella sp. UC29_106 TaxID=3374553 RepID=UPI0037580381
MDAIEQPKLSRMFRLQWEEAQNAYVLLYPEGLVRLNTSAAEILKRCDGRSALADIVAQLEQAFNASNLAQDVQAFVADARQRGWLV